MKTPTYWHYADPYRGLNRAIPGRVDMGFDVATTTDGPVYPIGLCTIVRLDTQATWPGGHYVAYRLLEGRMKGRCVYLAEHLTFPKTLKIGDRLHKNEPIAKLHTGFPNSESGWAVDGGVYAPVAYGCYKEGDITAAGMDFARFIKKLGGPQSPDLGKDTVCPLPKGWKRA